MRTSARRTGERAARGAVEAAKDSKGLAVGVRGLLRRRLASCMYCPSLRNANVRHILSFRLSQGTSSCLESDSMERSTKS
jgi:hypothetical protein